MRNCEDTFERRKRSFISAFFQFAYCISNDLARLIMIFILVLHTISKIDKVLFFKKMKKPRVKSIPIEKKHSQKAKPY